MKRLQVLLLVSLASVLLFSGCGKKEEEADEPAVAQVIEKQPELEKIQKHLLIRKLSLRLLWMMNSPRQKVW